MKLEWKKILPKLILFFGITTLVFAGLSFFNIENLLLRIITQASACLVMFVKGIHTISYQKERARSGYVFIGIAAFILVVMLNTIIVTFKA